MKLWLLRPAEKLPKDNNPWDPWYDKAFGFVVRAETEADARERAQENGGDEVGSFFPFLPDANIIPAWTDSKLSTCVELSAEGDVEIIIRDFASA